MNRQSRRQDEQELWRLFRFIARTHACCRQLDEANVTIALAKQQIAGARKKIEKSKQPSVEYLLGILGDLDSLLKK